MLAYDNAVRGSHAFSYFSRVRHDEPLMILGDAGVLFGNHDRLTLRPHEGAPRTFDIEPDTRFPLAHHVGYGPMYEHWHRVIRGDEPPRTGASVAFENLLTAHAAQAALDREQVITRADYLTELGLSESPGS